MTAINKVIPEKDIIILSPHFDDVPLTYGGYLGALKGLVKQKRIRIVLVFSRSNYQARDDKGNKDTSLKHIRYATGIRLMEDLNCLDALLGHGNYRYELMAERECVLRQKGWKEGEKFEFPWGDRTAFDKEDREIFNRIKERAREWLSARDTALLVPLGFKEHIDHIIVRDAVVEARADMKPRARIYFGEDQPYTGLANHADWQKAMVFLKRYGARPVDFAIDAKKKKALIFKCYPTQVEKSYGKGILNRTRELKGAERLWRL
jgi:hypothetical protein